MEDVPAVWILHHRAIRDATVDRVPGDNFAVFELAKFVFCFEALAVLCPCWVWTANAVDRDSFPRGHEEHPAEGETEPEFPVRQRPSGDFSVPAGDVLPGDCRLFDPPPAVQATIRTLFNVVKGSRVW